MGACRGNLIIKQAERSGKDSAESEEHKMKRTAKEFFEQYHEARWNMDGTYEERRQKELEMFREWYDEMEVGDHCHICQWSDVEPCTIIKRTATSITVRHDKAELNGSWKPEFIPGGFGAHCVNNDDQSGAWDIAEDPDGYVEVFRWSKKFNCYKNKHDDKLFPEWAKKYDYNF